MFSNKYLKMISATISVHFNYSVHFKYPTITSAYIVKPENRQTKSVSGVSQNPIFSMILVFDSKRLRNRAKTKNKRDKTIIKRKKDIKKQKKEIKKEKTKKNRLKRLKRIKKQ